MTWLTRMKVVCPLTYCRDFILFTDNYVVGNRNHRHSKNRQTRSSRDAEEVDEINQKGDRKNGNKEIKIEDESQIFDHIEGVRLTRHKKQELLGITSHESTRDKRLRSSNYVSSSLDDRIEDSSYRRRSNRHIRNSKENTDESEPSNDEDEKEKDQPRQYSFRNREMTRRDISTLNVKTLGGETYYRKGSHRHGRNSGNDSNDHKDNSDESEPSNDEKDQPRPYSFRNREMTRRDISTLNVKTLGGETYYRKGSHRLGRNSGNDSNDHKDNSDESEPSNDEDDEKEKDQPRQYTFRNREMTKRDISTLNVKTLGGDGAGCARSNAAYKESRDLRESARSNDRNYVDTQPRMHFGGRISNWNHHSYKNHRPQHRRRTSFGVSDRKHFDSSSESSSGSSKAGTNSFSRFKRSPNRSSYMNESDEDGFSKYESNRLAKERKSIQPINDGNTNQMGGSLMDKASKRDLMRADVAPIAIDSKIGFSAIGGLDKHVASLKEMVILPLLYPDVFEKFDSQPPRGVLFVGPPGTGKTLTARALANSVSGNENGRKVSFFMRKGADCLSKWVGEGERQLRLLFEQAKRYQPSIIFFDEIDGLAPVRSVKQDQIHASIVSTLLALMDGLDARGQVVVIGATNRPDAIDPALRRPGRFDRELMFPLPSASARSAILDIHTKNWDPKLTDDVKNWIVESTSCYCGADIKALCNEAAIVALRRTYPQVYPSSSRLALDLTKLKLGKGDFAAALNKVIPSSRRSASPNVNAKPLDNITAPLLGPTLNIINSKLNNIFPVSEVSANKEHSGHTLSSLLNTSIKEIEYIPEDSEQWIAALTDMQDINILSTFVESRGVNNSSSFHSTQVGGQVAAVTSIWNPSSITARPRLMIAGEKNMGQIELAMATLQQVESLSAFSIEITSLLSDIYCSLPEQALVNRIQEAYRQAPSVIFLPDIISWWKCANETMRITLLSIVENIPATLPVLWLTTVAVDRDSFSEYEDDKRLQTLLLFYAGENSSIQSNGVPSGTCTIEVTTPSDTSRAMFFDQFFSSLYQLPATIYGARKSILLSRIQSVVVETASVKEVAEKAKNSTSAKNDDEGNDDAFLNIPQDPMDIERDLQCQRELRTFFRASLNELHKEKRCNAFSRPVDPEMVPDYYSIIKCPMDLETMRMKVDEHIYPTLGHFLRDIEQIAFNAREYNPMTLKDQRGRYIVHSANSMRDIVESHAYNFNKEVGYDLFKRCDQIARRNKVKKLLPITSSDEMPSENKKFYAEIIELHLRLKYEAATNNDGAIEDNHDDDKKQDHSFHDDQYDATQTNQRRSSRRRNESELEFLELPAPQRKRKAVVLDTADVGNGNETQSINEAAVIASDTAVVTSDPVEMDQSDELPTNEEIIQTIDETITTEIPPVVPEFTVEDIDSSVLMTSLKQSIIDADALKQDNYFDKLMQKCTLKTRGYSILQLITMLTSLNRIVREFPRIGDIKKVVNEIENYIQNETEK